MPNNGSTHPGSAMQPTGNGKWRGATPKNHTPTPPPSRRRAGQTRRHPQVGGAVTGHGPGRPRTCHAQRRRERKKKKHKPKILKKILRRVKWWEKTQTITGNQIDHLQQCTIIRAHPRVYQAGKGVWLHGVLTLFKPHSKQQLVTAVVTSGINET